MSVGTRPVCWLNACFQVPDDWEITAYSIEPRAGRLEFGTRHGLQGFMSWETASRAPDRDVLFSAFPVRPGQTRKEDHFQTAEAGRFTLAWGSESEPCLAVGFLAGPKKLLRWVFPTAVAALREGVITPILASVEPNGGPFRRWCAFGLDFRLPAEYQLEHARIQPADVELVFESDRRARAIFHRWGLPEALLRGLSLEAFYTERLHGAGARVRDIRRVDVRGMDGVEAAYSQTGEHQMDRFMGRAWTSGQGRLWLDRTAKRLLAVEQIGPPNVALPSFESLVGGERG